VIEGVTVISGGNTWAVGTYDSWSASLIEHWNGTHRIWHLAR
jgi:hypothetical protein